MNLLHRFGDTFETALRQRVTVRAMSRLSDRNLADIGLARDEILPAARIAARSGPQGGASLAEVARRLREAEGARDAGRAGRAAPWPELPLVTRHDRAEFVKEGRRWRAEEGDKLSRSLGHGLARLSRALAQPILAALEAAGVSQRVELALLRRRELRRVSAELGTYSERELAADLRMSPSAIPDAAAEEADRRVDAFVREHPAYRAAWRGQGRRSAGFGYADG